MNPKTWKIIILSIIILSIIILFFGLFIILPIAELTKIDLFPNKDGSLASLYSASLIILTFLLFSTTALLVYVAYSQLEQIDKTNKAIGETNKADFLLRIDERFSSPEIIKARTIIHELYRKADPHCTHSEIICNKCSLKRNKIIRNEIKKMGRDVLSAEKFIYLRNLLDFLETIGYFSHEKFIEPKQVNELIGGTIEFHYEIFRDWIEYLDKKDSEAFIQFEWLAYQVNNKSIPLKRKKKNRLIKTNSII